MTNYEYFHKQTKYWAKRLNIKVDSVLPDRKLQFQAIAIQLIEPKINILMYSPDDIAMDAHSGIMHTIFHELAHFKGDNFRSNYPYDTYTNQMISEYKAETQALIWLKKYYPKYYKQFVKDIKDSFIFSLMKLPKSQHYYLDAFFQIPEYQEAL